MAFGKIYFFTEVHHLHQFLALLPFRLILVVLLVLAVHELELHKFGMVQR